jgi:hypothetical protein
MHCRECAACDAEERRLSLLSSPCPKGPKGPLRRQGFHSRKSPNKIGDSSCEEGAQAAPRRCGIDPVRAASGNPCGGTWRGGRGCGGRDLPLDRAGLACFGQRPCAFQRDTKHAAVERFAYHREPVAGLSSAKDRGAVDLGPSASRGVCSRREGHIHCFYNQFLDYGS